MKNANQPAQPLPSPDLLEAMQYSGLTKREYFAAKAMQGMLANPEQIKDTPKEISDLSINIADTLLNKLEETQWTST